MTTFRSKLFALIALLTLSVTGFAQAQDTAAPNNAAQDSKFSAERLVLAKQYIETAGFEAEVRNAITAMASNVAAENRVLYRRLAETGVDYNRLRAAAELAVLDVFTDAEIKAMNAFYGTPEGKSIQGKMREYDKRMQPVINDALGDFVKKLQENDVIPK